MTPERADESDAAGGRPGEEAVDCITSDARTAGAALDVLSAAATSEPELVEDALDDLAAVVTDAPDQTTVDDRVAAVAVVAEFATMYPAHATEVVSALATTIDEPAVETPVLRAIAAVAATAPADVDPVLDAVVDRLTDGAIAPRRTALEVIEARADDDPEALSPFVPRFVEVVATSAGLDPDAPALPDPVRSRRYEEGLAEQRLGQRTATVLAAVAAADPSAVAREFDTLCSVLDPGNGRNVTLEGRVLDIVATIAERTPEGALDAVDHLLAVVGAADAPAGLRANAAGTLATLADARFDAATDGTRQVVPALGTLLEHEEPAVRANAATLLSYVAQRHPGEVASLTDVLAERLGDEQVPTRAGVVWTLGYLDTEAARDALRETAATDPDPEVRGLAERRLSTEP